MKGQHCITTLDDCYEYHDLRSLRLVTFFFFFLLTYWLAGLICFGIRRCGRGTCPPTPTLQGVAELQQHVGDDTGDPGDGQRIMDRGGRWRRMEGLCVKGPWG